MGSVKFEEVYLKANDCIGVARASLGQYPEFYNQERLHQSHDRHVSGNVNYHEAARLATRTGVAFRANQAVG